LKITRRVFLKLAAAVPFFRILPSQGYFDDWDNDLGSDIFPVGGRMGIRVDELDPGDEITCIVTKPDGTKIVGGSTDGKGSFEFAFLVDQKGEWTSQFVNAKTGERDEVQVFYGHSGAHGEVY
jgi:hypothetical protein